ncbi:DUF4390 domain-containing protein [Uliginosibacterium sp. TH139]|uniref:DUF4390 domain-containing protein n=1 Tax=Uliginosibacterium sp. TH139 TaxID=2067453 RepID=UPI0013040F08|nr:DUF4390 domain-containing protein [Uliginosibacterium sp. TH139]
MSLLRQLWLLIFMMLCAPAAQAAGKGLDFRFQEIVPVDQVYVVNASLEMQANPRLEEMIASGVSIPFQAEFTLTRTRWYWLDESVVERNLDFRLSYHALTRQYRLSVGSIHRSFGSFEDALRALLSIRNWSVIDRNRLTPGETYKASLRFRLDMSQLPKPFQVVVFGNRELDVSTGWVQWNFLAQGPDPR